MRATAILAVVLVLVASSLALPTKKEYAPPVSGTKGLLDCSNAIAVSCGDIVQGDNTGFPNNVELYSCVGWTESGGEVVYVLVLDPPNTYDVTASLSDMSCDLDVFILGSCDEDDCIAYGNTSATAGDLAAGTYYIVVDGYNGAECGYTLAVECTELTPPCCPSPYHCHVLDFNLSACGLVTEPCGNGVPAWEWGVPVGIPDVACDGVTVTNVVGTTLTGPYPVSMGDILVLGPFYVGPACWCLEVCHYYDFESDYGVWDGGNVKISHDGTTWTLVTPSDGYDGVAPDESSYYHPECVAGEPVFAHSSGGFVRDCFDLSEYMCESYYIGFFVGSDTWSTDDLGWYIKWVKLGGQVTATERTTWGAIKAFYR